MGAFEWIVGFLNITNRILKAGVVIPLIFPNVPLRFPNLPWKSLGFPSYPLPLNIPPLGTLQITHQESPEMQSFHCGHCGWYWTWSTGQCSSNSCRFNLFVWLEVGYVNTVHGSHPAPLGTCKTLFKKQKDKLPTWTGDRWISEPSTVYVLFPF